MVRIIRNKEEAAEEPCIDFKVYMSSKDRSTVCGYSNFDYQIAADSVAFVKSSFGVPAAEAFQQAKEYAEANHIPYIFIDDPEGLFNEAE